MPPAKERRDGDDFINQIPALVRRAMSTHPDGKSRQAGQQLINFSLESDRYEPVIAVVTAAQQVILASNDIRGLRNATRFFDEYTRLLFVANPRNQKSRTLPASETTRRQLERIVENHKRLWGDRRKGPILPEYYNSFAMDTAPQILEHIGEGFDDISVTPYMSDAIGSLESRAQNRAWNDWSLGFTKVNESEKPLLKDDILEHLRTEPAPPEGTFLTRRYGGISFEDIEKMEGTEDDFGKIADYLAGMLENSHGTHREMLHNFFLSPTRLHGDNGLLPLKNTRLFALLNRFQEVFVYRFINPTPPVEEEVPQEVIDEIERNPLLRRILDRAEKIIKRQPKPMVFYETNSFPDAEKRIQQVLQAFSPSDAETFLNETIFHWAMHPHLYYEDYDPNKQNPTVAIRPELATAALVVHLAEKGLDMTVIADPEEARRAFLHAELFPVIKKRFEELGVSALFSKIVTKLEIGMAEYKPLEERLLASLKKDFETNAGGMFLETLKDRIGEIDTVTDSVWKNLLDGNIHYLPMAMGTNVIDFTNGSTPSLLGIEKLEVIRMGDTPDWELYTRFKFKNSHTYYPVILNHTGAITFSAPIQQEIPDLYVMLKNIVVLTVHDLMIQNPAPAPKEGQTIFIAKPEPTQEDELLKDMDTVNGLLDNFIKTKGKGLPRKQQTDKKLVADVYRKTTGQPPRVVEIHRSHVPGAKRYIDLINQYNGAVARKRPAFDIERLQQELTAARSTSYQASESKRNTSPAGMQLRVVTDPLTQEKRYVETWVVEHTRPTPTAEEIASPTLMFQRYYRNSSGVAFLDQMKPWFVGQAS